MPCGARLSAAAPSYVKHWQSSNAVKPCQGAEILLHVHVSVDHIDQHDLDIPPDHKVWCFGTVGGQHFADTARRLPNAAYCALAQR